MSSSLFQTLNISRQDMQTRLLDLDVTSNNLANINTAGYKTSRSNFQEMLDQQIKGGVLLPATQMLGTQGAMQNSDNPLDLAIQGEGFFSVTLPDGTTGYTRDGQLSLDVNQDLVSSSGFPVIFDGTIPDGTISLTVGVDGKMTAKNINGGSSAAGTIQLSRFPNSSGLINRGDNIWLESDSSGIPLSGDPGSENFGTIFGSVTERANVDLGQELTHLITLQRSFSMSVKVFQGTDTMISQAINLRKG